jgi:DNA-directed RNA polymerase specialized sigma24 family protein
VIDHLRRTCREAEAQALLNEPEVGGGDLFDVEAPDDTYLPEACLEREEFRRQIRRAIDRLKDTPHFYILERFYLGFSIEEIAGYHSETTNQVYKALKSALRDLGRMLQEDALTQADLRRAFDAPSQVLVSLARKKNRKSVDTVG